MPDADEIRLILPAEAELAAVASVAVRAAGRQVALSERDIDQLRAAVVSALEERTAVTDADTVVVVLRAGRGSLEVVVDGEPVG